MTAAARTRPADGRWGSDGRPAAAGGMTTAALGKRLAARCYILFLPALCLVGIASCAAPGGEKAAPPAGKVIAEALRLEGEGEFGPALDLLTRFEGAKEGRRRCLDAAAGIALGHGQPSMAVLFFEKAIALVPDDPDLYLKKGEALMAAGRERGAETALLKCLSIDWSRDRAKVLLAKLYLAAGYKEKAATYLDSVSPGFAWDSEGLLVLGAVRHAQGKNAEALDLFARAARAAPFLADSWFSRGRVLEDEGDPAGAVKAYREALARDSGHVPSLFNLGRLLVASGSVDEGRKLLDEACSREVDSTVRRSLLKTRDRLLAGKGQEEK